jgi:hypothetical protein
MNIALKEWSSVIAALDQGHQIFLLRKGGIVEQKRGFEVRHKSFLLYPSFEHQHALSLKAEFRHLAQPPPGPGILISHMADVTDVRIAPNVRDRLVEDTANIWNESLIDMRYNYRPDLPLFVLVLRAYRLRQPVTIPDRPSYAGCKSWVNLTEEIAAEHVTPILDDAAFAARRMALLRALR